MQKQKATNYIGSIRVGFSIPEEEESFADLMLMAVPRIGETVSKEINMKKLVYTVIDVEHRLYGEQDCGAEIWVTLEKKV